MAPLQYSLGKTPLDMCFHEPPTRGKGPLLSRVASSELFFKFRHKFGLFDHVALVGSVGDRLALVEDLEGEADPGAVYQDDLDLGPDDEPDRDRPVVLEVDVGAQGDLPGSKRGLDAGDGRRFDQLDQLRGGEGLDPPVPGLLGGHPFFDPALKAVGVADLEFRAHCPIVITAHPNQCLHRFSRV